MSDDDATKTPEQKRLEAAAAQLADINRLLPDGMPAMQPPPWTDLAATIDTLARLLVDKGLVSEEEIIAAKTLRLAEIVEQFVAGAREQKRALSGLVIPGGSKPH